MYHYIKHIWTTIHASTFGTSLRMWSATRHPLRLRTVFSSVLYNTEFWEMSKSCNKLVSQEKKPISNTNNETHYTIKALTTQPHLSDNKSTSIMNNNKTGNDHAWHFFSHSLNPIEVVKPSCWILILVRVKLDEILPINDRNKKK